MARRLVRVLAAVAVGALVGAAFVGAQGTASTDIVTACTENPDGTGLVRIRSTCAPGEAKVTWNHSGPAGPSGAKGPAGAPGPAGADSAAITRVETASAPIHAVGVQSLTVNCRSGEHVVSGGYRIDNPDDFGDFRIHASRPMIDGTGWYVQAEGWFAKYRLIAFAACAPQGR